MGCNASNVSSPKCPIVSIEGVDLDSKSTRKVGDSPLDSIRMRPVDWRAIIKQGKLWEDPNFPADVSSLIDPKMSDREN